MHYTATRFIFAAALAGLTFATLRASANGDAPPSLTPVPAPMQVAPTIPAPVPPAHYHIRFNHLLPKQKDGAQKPGDKNGAKLEVPPLIETGPELSLGECIAVALERQPSLKAARASLAATERGAQALLNFGTVGTLISPDLEIRKQQAQRGRAAACAEYQKAQQEVIQDVTRLYYTAVYAKQAEQIVNELTPFIQQLIDVANDLLEKTPNPKDLEGLTRGKVDAMEIGLREALAQQAKARIGRKQAMAALRQIMAVDEETFPFRLKDAQLPVMEQKVPFDKKLVVDQALARRPELAMAAAGVDAFRLEVYAQGKIPFKRVVPTFASGSDLHSKAIPQTVRGKEYRPGGIIPELPPQLIGSKYDRVSRAMAYSQKADAVYESVQDLVTLEAENGFFEFELASERLRLSKQKLDIALTTRDRARKSAGDVKDKSIIVQAEVLAATAQADYLGTVLEHLLALSALERITAGGIYPRFPGR
jgi:outer membrane protein TolC